MQSVLNHRLFVTLEIVTLGFIGIALVAEILPEVEAKPIVISALIVALTVNIIRISKK
jgi:hypothetical protein